MRGKISNARTIGNILIQLLKDNLVETSRPDGTLSGPTSTAWFYHWRRYLERQLVKFKIGKLVGFRIDGDEILPIGQKAGGQSALEAAYVVIAIPVHDIRALLDHHRDVKGADCDRIRALDLGDPTLAVPGGTVEHMSGIQYYFDSEVKFISGHTHFPDSEWGLTAIFQPQFWRRRRGWWTGYRGVLSVDIGNLHEVSTITNKCAWESTADEIAAEVWRQIKATLKEDRPIPEPFLYHFDNNIVDEPGGRRNRTPLLINRVGEFGSRAGPPRLNPAHQKRHRVSPRTT